jgi:hypothetical protein
MHSWSTGSYVPEGAGKGFRKHFRVPDSYAELCSNWHSDEDDDYHASAGELTPLLKELMDKEE